MCLLLFAALASLSGLAIFNLLIQSTGDFLANPVALVGIFDPSNAIDWGHFLTVLEQ